jgi:signal transduction histidine kinase
MSTPVHVNSDRTPASAPGSAAESPRVRMPLGRKLIVINLALVVALAVLGVALTWGVQGMRRAVSSAANEYTELRKVEGAMYHCSLAKSNLTDPARSPKDATWELEQALDDLKSFRDVERFEAPGDEEHQETERHAMLEAEKAVRAVLAAVDTSPEADARKQPFELIDNALFYLSQLADQTDIAGARAAASERTVTTLIVVAALASLIVLGSMIASAVCYWAVMNPLKRLHKGVRRLASGTFDERLEEGGSREFSELAADFNTMASELANLYTDLEKKVQSKSQELVRSERLASVGFLAAGVAHEINNPLNIMSGYAEMAQGWLDSPRGGRNGNLAEVQEALEIIRQEAFRCKDITGKLLSLATTGDLERSAVSLPRLINEVVQMLRGLKKYRDRAITVTVGPDAGQPVRASASEIKQVLLNLLVNALEAVPATGGDVHVACRAVVPNIEIAVSDNGVGMTSDVLERVFEPFFTTRRQPAGQHGNRGVGLGLSISNAIITSHGGKIRAESDGPGTGSRFIIELPIDREASQEAIASNGHINIRTAAGGGISAAGATDTPRGGSGNTGGDAARAPRAA